MNRGNRAMRKYIASIGLCLIAVTACAPSAPPVANDLPQVTLSSADLSREARLVFGNLPTPTTTTANVFGAYAGGCVAGAVQLAETGPTWQAMRLSRNRNWAHPDTVTFVQDLSARMAAATSWSGLYIGDMSQPRGGPMLSGHASHQSGLDADIWLLPARNLNLSQAARENLSSISMQAQRGASVNENWTEEHATLIRLAASDPRVSRIFVFPAAKVWMCENETGDRSYLRKIRPWFGHHYHIHVRLNCPLGASDCEAQDAPPVGDGCADAQAWVNNILNPPPPDPDAPDPEPRRALRLGDLPAQCQAISQL